MDDFTIAAVKLDTLLRFKCEMSKRYKMKDLGELHFILGLQVRRDRTTRSLHLNQKLYIDTLYSNGLECLTASQANHHFARR